MLCSALDGYGEVTNQEVFDGLLIVHWPALISHVKASDILPHLIQRDSITYGL